MVIRIFFVALFVSSLSVYSQKSKVCAYTDYWSEVDIALKCGFIDESNGFTSDKDAEEVIDAILDNVGLFRNFIIKECPNISNAYAVTMKSSLGHFENYIIYDKIFLDRVKGDTGSDWSAISIMAHEIGHHLNGHTLTEKISSHQQELQADSFSGFVLARLGATLDESLRAINTYSDEKSSQSHPNKVLRIKSITEGWKNAKKGDIKLKVSSSIEIYSYNKKKMNNSFNKALKEYENKNYGKAGNYFSEAFKFSDGTEKKYLNYAAGSYILDKDYDNGLKHYLLLLKNGINSLDEKLQIEAYRNISLIYASKNEFDKATVFLKTAQKESPNNIALLEIGALFQYNLGYKAFVNSNYKVAITHYNNAITLNPNFKEAYINLSTLILDEEKSIISQMNSLGESESENRQYEYLNNIRLKIYKKAIPYLEKVLQIDPNEKRILPTLLSIYSAMGDTENQKRIERISTN